MRYTVQKHHDGMGNEYMGHDGPKPIVLIETDDRKAAWHEMKRYGGELIDWEEETITDGSGESCSFKDAGFGGYVS